MKAFLLGSTLYIVLFLLLMSLHRDWVIPEKELTTNECFTRFFLAGIVALIIHHVIATFNLAE